MALTLRRWLLIAGVGGAVITLAYWPLPPSEPAHSFPLYRRPSDVLLGDLRTTTEQLGVLQRRDAILASRSGVPRPGEPPALRIDLPLPPAAREALNRSFAALVSTWRPFSPEVAMLLVITKDSMPAGANLSDIRSNGFWHFHPDGTDGHLCLSVAFTSHDDLPWEAQLRSAEEIRAWLSRAAGPCPFYAAFGKAGPGVEAWLRYHNDKFARTADWNAARDPIDVPVAWADLRPELSIGVLLDLMMGGAMANRTGFTLRGCGSGRRAACASVLDSAEFGEVPPFGTRYGVARSFMWGWDQTESSWLLADLVRSVGRDRFGAFWRSPAPRDDAFRMAVGEDIRDYTHTWLQGRFRRLRVGPQLPLGIALLGLAMTVVLVSATAAYSTRRQVR